MSKAVEMLALGAAGAVGIYALTIAGSLVMQGPDKKPRDMAAVPVVAVPKTTEAPKPATGQPAAKVAAAPKPATAEAAKPAPAAAPAAQAAAAAPAAAVPDPKAGQAVFAKCKTCHSIAADGKSAVGPALYGVVNRATGSVAGFAYSANVKKAGETWTPALLDAYLTDPKKVVPGTKMAFAGLPSAKERADVIAYLAENSATPIAPAALGLSGGAPAAASAAPAAAATPAKAASMPPGVTPAPAQVPPAAAGAAPAKNGAPPPVVVASAAPAEAQPAAAPEGAPVYRNPPAPGATERLDESLAVARLANTLSKLDYERARHHPLHFKPVIDTATNGECLVCHSEVLTTNVSQKSPAGVEASKSLAWYQTLSTYQEGQQTFHQRHMTSAYASQVMNLKCNFCHQGNDVREESPTMTVAPKDMTSNNGQVPFTNRKMVNPSETCLLCHGAMPDPQAIMGLPGKWHEIRGDMENDETPNGCLTCHAEQFRTNRHNVTYLNAANIEDLAKLSSDVCYGCHGGRAWFRISYPYPRHPWPGMDTSVTPDWAKDRKATSDPRYILKTAE